MRLFLIALATLLLDQTTKTYVKTILSEGESLPVISKIFHITLINNTGAAFGIFAGKTFFLTTITFFVVLAVIFFHRRVLQMPPLFQVGLALIVGGAVGNLLDRLRTGAVVDFLDFRVWPVFNVADMGIVLGMVLLIYITIKWDRPEGERD